MYPHLISTSATLGQLLRSWACFAVVASDAWSLQHLNSPCFSKRREHTHVFQQKNWKSHHPIVPILSYPKKNPFLESLEKRELPSENLKVNNCDFCRLESAVTLLVRQPPKISKSANDLQKKGVPLWHRARLCHFLKNFNSGFTRCYWSLEDWMIGRSSRSQPMSMTELLDSWKLIIATAAGSSHRVGSLGVSVAPKVSSEGW